MLNDTDPKLYQDPGVTYPDQDPHLDFSNYIKQCRDLVTHTRLDLQHDTNFIIDANSPFELSPSQPSTTGVLLIHGLFDSPFMLRDIGNDLQQEGLLVRSVLLPGHGTVPGALLNLNYQDWLRTVTYGIQSIKKEVKKLFIVGFSTGATLALHYLKDHRDIDGIIMIAPALKTVSHLTSISHWFVAAGKLWERAAWLHKEPEINYVKYQSVTYNSVYQVYQLMQSIQSISQEALANCPLFMAGALHDRVIDTRASIDFFNKLTNPNNRLLIYTNGPFQTSDPRTTIRNSAYPDLGILDFSHTNIPIKPENKHYGMHGDYSFASHIDPARFEYGAQNKFDEFFNSLFFKLGIQMKQRHRLTFNPDYPYFISEIKKFIADS